MRVVQARTELACKFKGCGGVIHKEDICVKHSYKNNAGGWSFLFFHVECYLQRSYRNLSDYLQPKVAELRAKVATRESAPPKRKGRPPKPFTKELQNLKNLEFYHRKAGNLEQVAELEEQIRQVVRRRDANI